MEPHSVCRWGAFSKSPPQALKDFAVPPGGDSGAAKLLYRLGIRPKDSELVHVVQYFQHHLPQAVHSYIMSQTEGSNADMKMWLSWCAPIVNEMYHGRATYLSTLWTLCEVWRFYTWTRRLDDMNRKPPNLDTIYTYVVDDTGNMHETALSLSCAKVLPPC